MKQREEDDPKTVEAAAWVIGILLDEADLAPGVQQVGLVVGP